MNFIKTFGTTAMSHILAMKKKFISDLN